MEIIKQQIAYNISKRNTAIKYIVIHDSGNKSKGANAMAHFNYFNGGNRQSSADFFVDDKNIIRINDYTKYYTWAVGDGKGKYGITNPNSVSIEICVNADGDYEKAYLNAVELARHLMTELNIPADRVVRHYDASRKNCPASMSSNGWERWNKFKKMITESGDLTMSQYEELKKEIEELKTKNEALESIVGEMYQTEDEIPDYYLTTIKPLIEKGAIKGVGNNKLNLPEIIARTLVIIKRDNGV